jgi:Transposase DDE domain/SWIM zinc finger
MDVREQRGLALVASKRQHIKHVAGARWLVPSQTDTGGYVVDADAGTCSCPDHEERGSKCKHIYAVLHIRQEVTLPDGATVTATTTVTAEARITYPQDWPAYNRAQAEEGHRVQLLLRALCDGIVQPPRPARGRRPALLADVVYAAALKVYGGMSGRRSTSDIRECADKGLVAKAPAYNTLFKYAERPELAPLLKALVHESAAPLRAVETTFAIDATGFAASTYARWFDEKYGQEKRCQRWIKLHAQVGTVTNVIASVAATESTVGDSVMQPLLASSVARGFQVREVSADKAYLSNDNLTAIETAGAVPYVPFKANSRGTGKSDAWRRLWHMFGARNDEFLAHYHQRSNVESTFSMVKRKFGASVRVKTFPAQVNEVFSSASATTSASSCTRSTSWVSSLRSGRAWRPCSHAASRSIPGRASERPRAPAHAAREDGAPLADRRTSPADRQQLARPDHVRARGGERDDRVPRGEADERVDLRRAQRDSATAGRLQALRHAERRVSRPRPASPLLGFLHVAQERHQRRCSRGHRSPGGSHTAVHAEV